MLAFGVSFVLKGNAFQKALDQLVLTVPCLFRHMEIEDFLAENPSPNTSGPGSPQFTLENWLAPLLLIEQRIPEQVAQSLRGEAMALYPCAHVRQSLGG